MPSVRPARIRRILLMVVVLATTRTLLGGGWAEQRTVGGFHIRATFPLDRYPHLLPELAQLERDVTVLLQLPSRREPVHLLLFADRESYSRYIKRYFPEAPRRRALFIKGSQPGWVLAYTHDEFEIDVRHESTHALLHSRLPQVPLWLDEGLAEYFEVPLAERQHDNPHEFLTKWAARFYRVPDLRELEDLRDMEQMAESEYRAAWAWVHFMLHGPPAARAVLIQYLRDIARRVPPGRLSDRLERALPDLRKSFIVHHRSTNTPFSRATDSRASQRPVDVRTPPPTRR